MAGEDGNLTKENFVKILKSSDFFLKSFDKNKDGVVTEVCRAKYKIKQGGKFCTLDRSDDTSGAGI